jgi:hypothetical protein
MVPNVLLGGFQVVDTHAFKPLDLPAMRVRLLQQCGPARFVRLQSAKSIEREVWESRDGQRFTIIYKRMPPHYLLCEVEYDDSDVVVTPVDGE